MSREGRYHDGYIEDAVGALSGDFLALALVALVIVAYLLFLAIVLIMRSFAKHPTNKALWVPLGIFLFCFLFAVATQGQSLFLVLAGASFLGLLLTAGYVELYYDDMLLPERNKEYVIVSVLRRP